MLADESKRVNLDAERAQHWLSVGAQPTADVARRCASSTPPACWKRERRAATQRNAPSLAKKATERVEARAKAAADKAAAAAAPAAE